MGHSSTLEVADIANRSGVARLVPIHHHPTRDDDGLDEVLAELRSATECEVLLPLEGAEQSIGTA